MHRAGHLNSNCYRIHISIKDCVVPVCERISVEVALQDLVSIGNLKPPTKFVKIGVMNESLNAADGVEYGSTQTVAKTSASALKLLNV